MGLQKQECADLIEKFKTELMDYDPEYDDMLGRLFGTQLAFRRRLGEKQLETLTDVEKSKLIRDHMEALTHECAELRELLAWKHWKKYPANFKIDIKEARFEVADMMCFLMNIAILLGMDDDSFFKHVYSKQLHNVERQKDAKYGYIPKVSVSRPKAKKGKSTTKK